MSQEAINLISAIAGLIAAGGGLWAARAAHRSAVAAQEAARHAEKVERRGALRDLIVTAHRVVAESLRVGSLIEELKTEYGTLATSSGPIWRFQREVFHPTGRIEAEGGGPVAGGSTKVDPRAGSTSKFLRGGLDPGTQQVRRLSHSGPPGKKYP
jgi:hypothetical protein